MSPSGLFCTLNYENKTVCSDPDLRFYLSTAGEDEEKADNYERKLTANILNVVAALALQSVRNTGWLKSFSL